MTEDEKRRLIGDLLARAETAERRGLPHTAGLGVTMVPQWHRDGRVESYWLGQPVTSTYQSSQ